MNVTTPGRRKQSAAGLLLWPMAALYAAVLASPGDLGEWFLYTVGAAIALIPPLFLGYVVGRMEPRS